MSRTKLMDRTLPDYTKGEEMFNTVSHMVGGIFAIFVLIICMAVSTVHGNVASALTSIVFGVSMIALYTVSSVYHGLKRPMLKKFMQVIDHCTIYLLIAGTYTPIALCALTKQAKWLGWTVFAVIWAMAAFAIAFTAIDLNKYKKLSMTCYIVMGWCIILAVVPTFRALGLAGFVLLALGGVFYTVGAVLYGLGKKHRYMHSVFHIFVILGSLAHFLCIALYVL